MMNDTIDEIIERLRKGIAALKIDSDKLIRAQQRFRNSKGKYQKIGKKSTAF